MRKCGLFVCLRFVFVSPFLYVYCKEERGGGGGFKNNVRMMGRGKRNLEVAPLLYIFSSSDY